MKKIVYSLLILLALANTAGAQELNAKITVVSTQVQGTEAKRIFGNLEKALFEFFNNQKWTKDNFTLNERIECNIQINVTEKVSTDEYKGTIQVTSSRPVYKASYLTPLFNYEDNNFSFRYVEFQNLEFNMNAFTSNLTSVMAYYAYMIIGYDYDSFSLNGGTEYFQKAQTIVSNAQSANEPGWKAFESNKNRYWLVENALAPVFAPIRESMYKYHRLGMDIMVDKTDDGRAIVLDALNTLQTLHKSRPASFNMQVFFNAKAQEIVNIFTKGQPDEKAKVVDLLSNIDPARSTTYSKIAQ